MDNSDDLSQLMPGIQQGAQQTSPGNTMALRHYIKVLGDKGTNLPAASNVPHKPRTDGLHLRTGSGRRLQRRHFIIKFRDDEVSQQQDVEVELDPETLKDSLLERAIMQRRALLEAERRPGSGWVPRRREFAITLPPLELEEEEEEQEEGQQQEEGELEQQLLSAEEEGQMDQLMGSCGLEEQAQWAAQNEWQAVEGVLAERQVAGRQVQLLRRVSTSTAAGGTPGSALQQGAPTPLDQQQAADSQHAQGRTPGTSLYGRYTPMEGVPERLLPQATRFKQPVATASRSALAPSGTPAGFTPLEGIPERLMAFRVPPTGMRPLGMPSASRMCSNEREPSVDSPVEGLVQEGARRSRGSGAAQPADADGFAFAPLQQQQQPEEYDDGDDDMGGGFANGGDYEGGFPFMAGRFPAHVMDAGVQTGVSLAAEQLEEAGGSPGEELEADEGAAATQDDDGGYDAGGYDAGGDYDYAYEQQQQQEPAFDEGDLPETSAAAQKRAPRRQVKNAGARLRNELKRKSLAVDPRVGRQEVVPGVRRSSRAKQEPLKWWLNEKLEFGREHKTMPTVRNVVHQVPNTPWQTVTDITRRPGKRQRAPTPHDIGNVLAGAAEPEEEEEEEEEEEQALEEQQQQWEQGEEEDAAEQQHEQQPQAARGRRRPQAKQAAAKAPAPAAKAPAPAAKASKKAAKGGRRGRR